MLRLRHEPDLDAKVLVVGGGPAGASAAAHLARRGIDVLVLDRQRFPRDKVCGDFVGPAAILELQRLGITEWPEYEEANPIHYAALHLDGKQLIHHPIPQAPGLPRTGRVIPRLVLDEWVLRSAEAAGARIRTRANVTGIHPDATGVTVEAKVNGQLCVLRAEAVIGADGSGSTAARVIRTESPRHEDRIIAVRAYYEGVQGESDTCDLYFSHDSFPGYYWLFPTAPGMANVGVGMVLETLPPTEEHLRTMLERLVESDPALRNRLRYGERIGKIVGWPLTTYNPRVPVARSRMLLAGDAAGLINPLNGEGIQYALLSGRWAADTLEACVQTGDFSDSMLSRYASRIEEGMRYDMALAGLIVQLIRNRRLNPAWLYALRVIVSRASRDDTYAQIVGGILAGLVPASDALSVRVIGGTATQAAISAVWDLAGLVAKGPGRVLDLALCAAEMASEIAGDAVHRPASFGRWGAGVVSEGVELATEVARQAMKKRRHVSL